MIGEYVFVELVVIVVGFGVFYLEMVVDELVFFVKYEVVEYVVDIFVVEK